MAEQSGSRDKVDALALILPFIILSMFAMLLIAAGVAGLMLPESLPRLARPGVAWSLIGSGVVMDIYAGVQIVLRLRKKPGR